MISATAEKKQGLLLGEARLEACSRGWVQHYGMPLLQNNFCVLTKSYCEQFTLVYITLDPSSFLRHMTHIFCLLTVYITELM